MTIDIEINRQDYADLNRHHFLKMQLLRTVLVGLSAIFILEYFLNRDGFNFLSTVISASVGGLIYFGLIAWRLQNTKNVPKEDGSILGKKTLHFNDGEIICTTPNSSATFQWSSVKRLDTGKNAWYLYLDANMAIVVPKRCFAGEAEQNEFTQLVENRMKAVLEKK